MNPECIITGCRLYIPDEGKSLWGDLWEIPSNLGRTFIFNGVLHNYAAAWDRPPGSQEALLVQHQNSEDKCLIVLGPYFERRGVVVVSSLEAELNTAAREYVRESRRRLVR